MFGHNWPGKGNAYAHKVTHQGAELEAKSDVCDCFVELIYLRPRARPHTFIIHVNLGCVVATLIM